MALGALVYSSLVWCGVELWAMCPVCGMFLPKKHPANHLYKSSAPDDGHSGARNMLSEQ